MNFRKTVNLDEMRDICGALASRHPALKDNQLFVHSVERFLHDSRCHFLLVEDDDAQGESSTPYACGIVKEYREPFNEKDLFGIEAFLFRDGEISLHLEILEAVSNVAAKRGVWGLCISPKSLSHAPAFETLAAQSGVTVCNLPKLLMQGAEPGVYSAFTDTPGKPAFYAHCLPLATQQERWDFEGVIATGTSPLYRGEGRADKFGCATLTELCSYVFANGFDTRGQGVFPGTLQAQLLHQGYVNQPTVSLTDSRQAAAYYATDKHKRKNGAVVFVVDRVRLLQHGRVFDAVATLQRTLPWLLGGFHDLIVRIMHALDAGHDDVRESGAFLQKCHLESQRRVETFGGGITLGPPVDWAIFLGPKMFETLRAAGVGTADLDAMNDEFEAFWNVALGRMATMETVHTDGRPAESTDLLRSYFKAFGNVEAQLKAAWARNSFSPRNHPGWDLSPFGYVAKTIRDGEFFSDGPVPASCIAEAVIVDQYGQEKATIAPKARLPHQE